MAAKAEKFVPAVVQLKPVFFTCKFCGESKPLNDLIVIRRFFPQLSACSECARSKRIEESEPAASEALNSEDKTK
jgi:transcription elongation factor Elf1